MNERLQHLLSQVRETKTLKGDVDIYKYAQISLITFYPEQVFPTAKYVLNSNLNFVANLRTELLGKGVDILKLAQIYEDSENRIAPPVVEYSPLDRKNVLVDGIHRFYLAKVLGLPVNSIYIRGADPLYPVYSTPVRWSEVIPYEERPEMSLRRDVRDGINWEDSSLYYRDLSYLGSTGRRDPRFSGKITV